MRNKGANREDVQLGLKVRACIAGPRFVPPVVPSYLNYEMSRHYHFHVIQPVLSCRVDATGNVHKKREFNSIFYPSRTSTFSCTETDTI